MYHGIYRHRHMDPTLLASTRHIQHLLGTTNNSCTFETSAPCDCAVSKATTARASGTGLKTLTQLLNEQLAAYRKKLVISSGGLDNVQVVRVQNSVRVKWDIKCSGKCNCTVGGLFVPASKTFDSYFWAARPTRRRTYLNSSSSHFAERAP